MSLKPETMMIARIAKIAAYAKAPKATFAMMHPLKAAKYGVIYFAVRSLIRSRGK